MGNKYHKYHKYLRFLALDDRFWVLLHRCDIDEEHPDD
jgi:hypothetical protein